jgi:YegS/Rv2252/BmrU family lipid kinase
MRALVVGRRRRGRRIGTVVRETRKRLEAAGWTVESAFVDRKKELRQEAARAVRERFDVVVAVGGDGAVLQVVQVLAETDVALGIVPMGTGNLLAGNLGIPHRYEHAGQVLLNGERKRIDLGRLTSGGKRRYFAVACGIGFDADVMKGTAKVHKLRWGKLAYLASAIRRSRHMRNATHEITIDGERSTMEAAQVFVANFGRMGAGFEPRLQVEADDGLLDVMVVRAEGSIPGLLAGWEALRQGELGESSAGHVFRARARKVKLSSVPPCLVETDGSVVGLTPIKVTIRPAALTVIVPAP